MIELNEEKWNQIIRTGLAACGHHRRRPEGPEHYRKYAGLCGSLIGFRGKTAAKSTKVDFAVVFLFCSESGRFSDKSVSHACMNEHF